MTPTPQVHYGYQYVKDGVLYGPFEVLFGEDDEGRRREALRIADRDGYWAVTWSYQIIEGD